MEGAIGDSLTANVTYHKKDDAKKVGARSWVYAHSLYGTELSFLLDFLSLCARSFSLSNRPPLMD